MPKGYWIITFRSVTDSAKLDKYIEFAAPVLAAAGVKFIVRGVPAKVYEAGVQERTVVIEFESVARAIVLRERRVSGISGGAGRWR